MTTTTLYYSPSTASLVVHWLLIELDVPHRLHELDFDRRDQKAPEYLKVNPAGVVPALDLDGQVITESAAILLHLADRYPQANLAPPVGSPERARYYQWMLFMANTLLPAYRAWFYSDEIAGAENVEAVRAHARQRIEAGWQRVSDHLEANGPWMIGGQLTVVDFMTTMLMRWSRNMPKPSDAWPTLKAYADRMKARPAFKEVYAREGLTDWT